MEEAMQKVPKLRLVAQKFRCRCIVFSENRFVCTTTIDLRQELLSGFEAEKCCLWCDIVIVAWHWPTSNKLGARDSLAVQRFESDQFEAYLQAAGSIQHIRRQLLYTGTGVQANLRRALELNRRVFFPKALRRVLRVKSLALVHSRVTLLNLHLLAHTYQNFHLVTYT